MTQQMTAADLIAMTEAQVGVIIAYPGEHRFYVDRAEYREGGAVRIFDHAGDSHDLDGLASEVTVLGTYNL